MIKAFLQTFLVGGGMLLFFPCAAIAAFLWAGRIFGGYEFTTNEAILAWSPLACAVAVFVGRVWGKTDKEEKETEDEQAAVVEEVKDVGEGDDRPRDDRVV